MSKNNLASKGFGIEEIVWLKKKDSLLGAAISLGIWFNNAKVIK